MTRVLVQRGSSGGGSSSNANRTAGSSSNPAVRAEAQVLVSPENTDEVVVVVPDDVLESGDKGKSEESVHFEQVDGSCNDDVAAAAAVVESDVREEFVKGSSGLRVGDRLVAESEGASGDSSSLPFGGGSCPPPPPVPPPKPSLAGNLNPRRSLAGSLNSASGGSSRRTSAWPAVPARTSPAGSRPSSPRSHNESEGYNSADEQKPCLVSSYDDFVS